MGDRTRRRSADGVATSMPRRIFAAAILAVAGALLYLAVPRTVAAVVALPKDHLIAHVLNGDALSPHGLNQLLASRQRALAWERSETRLSELALATFLQAEELSNAGDADGSRADVEQTIALSREGLVLAPARPFSWARLAYAEFVRDPTSPETAAALEMSLMTAPYEPLLTFVRLELGLRAWDILNDRQRQLLHQQIAVAWRQSADTLVNVAVLTDRTELVRDALPATADGRLRFETLLRDATQPDDSARPAG